MIIIYIYAKIVLSLAEPALPVEPPMSHLSFDYPADAVLGQLSTAEHLVVISLRLWALPYLLPQRHHPDWRAGLRAAGTAEASIGCFDSLLEVLFTASRNGIEVHRLECKGISRHEGWLLHCISLYQHDRVAEAETILAVWLAPNVATMAGSLAMQLASALDAARLIIPPRIADYSQSRFANALSSGVNGLALIH
jgi:hypothetical protein